MTPFLATGKREFTSRTVLVAAVFGIAFVGNLRTADDGFDRSLVDGVARPGLALIGGVATTTADSQSGREGALDGRLIPAIFAWDPAVRFEYFRRLSKWM